MSAGVDQFRLVADGQGRVDAVGVITFDNAADVFHAAPPTAPRGGCTDVDLSKLADADSATLAVLISWVAQAQAQGARLRYLNAPAALRNLARLSDVDGLLGLSESN
jgi:ABC-type transporter Mla MlaB component